MAFDFEGGASLRFLVSRVAEEADAELFLGETRRGDEMPR